MYGSHSWLVAIGERERWWGGAFGTLLVENEACLLLPFVCFKSGISIGYQIYQPYLLVLSQAGNCRSGKWWVIFCCHLCFLKWHCTISSIFWVSGWVSANGLQGYSPDQENADTLSRPQLFSVVSLLVFFFVLLSFLVKYEVSNVNIVFLVSTYTSLSLIMPKRLKKGQKLVFLTVLKFEL